MAGRKVSYRSTLPAAGIRPARKLSRVSCVPADGTRIRPKQRRRAITTVEAEAGTRLPARAQERLQELTMTADPTSAALQPAGDRTAAAAPARK
jgi:hypothetical protein